MGHVGEKRGAYVVVVGKPEGKRLLGRLRWRWEDNTKMNIEETGRGGIDWCDLADEGDKLQDPVNTVV